MRFSQGCAASGLAGLLLAVGFVVCASETWTRAFEGPDYGAFLGATVSESSILAVGTTNHQHMPPYEGDILIVSVSLEGNVLWERTWGGDGYEQAWDVIHAPDGGYLVFGETDSIGAGGRDFLLLRLDTEGETIWQRTYGTPQREWPFGMLKLVNGDLLLYGRTERFRNGPENPYAVRVTAAGDVVWEYTEAAWESELLLDAIEMADGSIIFTASIERDPKLVALNAEGSLLWEVRLELPGWQFGSAIVATNDGLLLAGFHMADSEPRQADVWLAKVSIAGELLWERSLGRSNEDDYAQSLLRLDDGSFLVGGLGNDLPLFKVDGMGELLWERRLANDGFVYAANQLVSTEAGGVLIPALRQIVGGRSYDAYLFRIVDDDSVGP